MSTDPTTSPQWDHTEGHLPEHHWPLPAVDETAPMTREPSPAEFSAVATSEQFRELKRRFTTFAFPMTALFLVWYLAYVLLSVYARGLMATPVLGNLNLGMVIGLLQFLSTFVITWLYIRHATKNLDPIASQLRADLEGAQ